MKRPLPLAALLALLLCPASAQTYYLNAPGSTWRYSSGETQTLGTPVTIKGVKVTPLLHQLGGKTISEDLLDFSGGATLLRGVRLGDQVTWYDPALTVYPPSPLAPGQRWESRSAGLKLSSRVMGLSPLKLASGNYNALLIRSDVSSGKASSTQYSYFVPGLGVVRYQSEGGQSTDLVK